MLCGVRIAFPGPARGGPEARTEGGPCPAFPASPDTLRHPFRIDRDTHNAC